MAAFFDFNYICRNCKSVKQIIDTTEWVTQNNKIIKPRTVSLKLDKAKAIAGTSFLIRPEKLFSSNEDVLFKYQYLFFASKRNYYDYVNYNYTGLSGTLWPEIYNVGSLKHNPLVELTHNQLHFKLEN